MADKYSKLKNGINYTGSFLGAVGTGIQNYLGATQFIQYLMNEAYALSDAGMGIAHSCGAALGGASSIFVNYLLNVELIRDFFKRMKRLRDRARLRAMQKHYDDQLQALEELKLDSERNAVEIREREEVAKRAKESIEELKEEIGEFTQSLSGWKKVMCWVGIGLFIISGLLYGLMAVAVAPEGALAILGIIAGALVTPIQTIQEIEVWVNWLDPLESSAPSHNSKLAKGAGIAFSFLSVVVLSTLFTLGVASFLMSFGVAALPALIVGACIAFTVGAFTEFFFYAPYLMDFCGNISKTWQEFKESKKPLLGFLIVGLNAAANGVAAGFAIGLLVGAIVAAGAAIPPFGGVLAVAILAGVIAAAASFMLGTKFWVRKFGNPAKPAPVGGGDHEGDPLLNDGNTDTYVARRSPLIKRIVSVPTGLNEQESANQDSSPVSTSPVSSRKVGFFEQTPAVGSLGNTATNSANATNNGVTEAMAFTN